MSFQPNFPARPGQARPTRIEILEAIDRLGDQAINTAGAGEGADNAQADWELVRAAAVSEAVTTATVKNPDNAAIIRAYNIVTDEDFYPESIQEALEDLAATVRRDTLRNITEKELVDKHLTHRNPADLACRDELVAAVSALIATARHDGKAAYRKMVVELALYGDEQWSPQSADEGLIAAIGRKGLNQA